MVSLLCAVPAHAQRKGDRTAVVILVPESSGRQILEALADPRWADLRSQSTFALSSAAVPGPDSLESAYLTIGAGRRMQWDPTQTVRYANTAGTLLRAPQGLAINVLGPAPARDGVSLAYSLGTATGGYEPLESELRNQIRQASERARKVDLLVVAFPPGTSAIGSLEMAQAIARKLDRTMDLIVLTSPNPDPPGTGEFRHLAPMLLWGRGWGDGVAYSATTRTRGLLSNTDLTPTVLQHLGIPIPATVEGHVARHDQGTLEETARYERHIRVTAAATIPILIGWGAGAFLIVAWVLSFLGRAPSYAKVLWGRALLAMALAAPVGMLLVADGAASSGAALALKAFLATLTVGLLAGGFAREWPPVLKVLLALVALVVVDLLTGGHMLARCLLGDFVNTGVRFYGIGNEYEGLMLGASTLAPFAIQSVLKPSAALFRREGWLSAGVIWTVSLVVVAHPALGADFGGALSLAAAFAAGAWVATGKTLRSKSLAVGVLLVMIVAVGVVAVDLLQPQGVRSHVGELAAQVLESGGARLWEVLGRKASMNLRMATTPYSLAGLAAVAVLGGICYHLLAARVRRVVASRPLLRAGSLATLLGACVAGALNDSGIVAGGLAVGCVLLLWLDAMLADQLSSSIDDRQAAIG